MNSAVAPRTEIRLVFEVFAIRHKPTGRFMPIRMFRTSSRGFSYWEPTETRPGYLPYDRNPRLFYSRQSAINAITMWSMGQWENAPTACGPFDEPERELAPMQPDVDRRRDDLEIVEFHLTQQP